MSLVLPDKFYSGVRVGEAASYDDTVLVHTGAATAYAKIGRARQHGLELQTRMSGWSSRVDLRPVASIAADRLSWELRLPVFDPPPLDEWALILGDAIHNIRSSLDVLVWAHIDEGALTEGQKKSISFPIWSNPEDWNKHSTRLLRTVPPDVVQRIRDCQPFQRPDEERLRDLLPLLAELDNRDKHRLAIIPVVRLSRMQSSHFVEFLDERAAARNVPPDVTVHAFSLVPQALLLSGTTRDPIKRIAGAIEVESQFGVELDGGIVSVVELIDMLVNYTTQVIGHVSP